jgi:hypothetical protein
MHIQTDVLKPTIGYFNAPPDSIKNNSAKGPLTGIFCYLFLIVPKQLRLVYLFAAG